jgi:hypothetical protein
MNITFGILGDTQYRFLAIQTLCRD